MKMQIENYVIKAVILGLVGLGAIIVYGSITREVVETKEPVIVSANMTDTEKDDDKPLQIIAREDIESINGLNEVLGVVGDNTIIARIGMNREEIEKLYKQYGGRKMAGDKETEFINQIYGHLFQINLATLEKTPFIIEQQALNLFDARISISPNGRKLFYRLMDRDYHYKDEIAIFDIKNQSVTKVNLEDAFNLYWSEDSRYIVGMSIRNDERYIVVYDGETNQTKWIKIDKEKAILNPIGGLFADESNNVYFLGKQDGIFKVSINHEEIDTVMILPKHSNSQGTDNYIVNGMYFITDAGKKVIFSGTLNGQAGLYIYTAENQTFNKVAESIGDPIVPFWVSPDGKKIIYSTFLGKGNQGKWTVYAAKIVGSELENKMMLCKDIDYLGGPLVWWSNDSKKVFLYETKRFDLDTRSIMEKGIVRKIYFK